MEGRARPLEAVRERIENVAAASPAGMPALAAWLAPEHLPHARAAELADRIAQDHPWAAVAAAGFRDDVLLPAAHSRALRREDLSRDPVVAPLLARAAEARSPLASLSLHPRPLERSAWFPAFTPAGATWSFPFGPRGDGFSPVSPADLDLEPASLPPDSLPAFALWSRSRASLGYPAGAPTLTAAAGAFVALLPEAAAEARSTWAREPAPAEAWAWLFCAALAGDNGPRRSCAEARVAAWRTLETLAGAAPGDADGAEALASEANWYLLDIDAPWFGRKARDAALVARFRTHWSAIAATE